MLLPELLGRDSSTIQPHTASRTGAWNKSRNHRHTSLGLALSSYTLGLAARGGSALGFDFAVDHDIPTDCELE